MSGASAAALNQLSSRFAAASEKVSQCCPTDDPTAFASAVTEIQSLKVQMQAATLVARSVDDLATELLSKPRR